MWWSGGGLLALVAVVVLGVGCYFRLLTKVMVCLEYGDLDLGSCLWWRSMFVLDCDDSELGSCFLGGL